jgi:very-short-patch-repair endonuclease
MWLGRKCRIDLAYPDLKIAIEIYSDEFHSDRFVGKKDASRTTELTRRGWRILEPLAEEIERDPTPFLKALVETLAEAGGADALRRGRRVNALNGTR